MRSCSPSRHARPGFTLVETMVAIIVLGVGLLVLGGSMGALLRLAADGGERSAAVGAIASLADSLRARPCSVLVDGADSTRGVVARWRIDSLPSARLIHLSVSFGALARRRTLTLSSAIPCRAS